jgi:glycosyltransferase involved in cell wall biosynthesis
LRESIGLRVLFLNRSYYPDVEATGQLLTELCSDLAKRHEVTVVAGRPNFVAAKSKPGLVAREKHQEVTILRVRNFRFSKARMAGRALGLVSYLVLAFWAALRHKRPDAIVVETDPPFLAAAGALLKKWHRCPLIFYLQDLFPEVALILGKLRPGMTANVLRWMTQVGLRNADRVVVLGDDMKGRVVARGIDGGRIAIVPNWADTLAVQPSKGESPLRKEWGLEGRFVVMYSGNLGLSQSLDHVLVCAKQLANEPVVFLFVGEGAAKSRLMAWAKDQNLGNVRFLPYQPKERLGESLSAADVHLVPLQRGLAGYIVPSKLYGILAAGRPYIAAVDEDSEVAVITRQGETGMRVEPDSSSALVESIRWCLANRPALEAMGLRGRQYCLKHFDRSRSVSLFEDVLRGLVKSNGHSFGCH